MKLRKKILLSATVLGLSNPVLADTSYQCFYCPAGTYSKAGATSCTNCPAGKYSTGGASSCLSCPAGTYSSVRSGNCISCLREGVATCDSKTGKVTGCLIGYGLSNGACYVCSEGLYSNGGSQTCSNNWTLLVSYLAEKYSTKPLTGSGTLDIGYYKIIVNGASDTFINTGYAGDQQQEIILVQKSSTYTYTAGVDWGSKDYKSIFKIEGLTEIIAEGGRDAVNGLGTKPCETGDSKCNPNGSVLIYKLN